MPPFDFIPQRIPMYQSLVRTRRFSGGSEGGTEVEWLDGYGPEITIASPRPPHLCTSPSAWVTYIHTTSTHSLWTEEFPTSVRSTLNYSCNFRCSGFLIPDVPKPGELASVIEILISQMLLTDGGGYCGHQSIVWNLRELTRVWVILSLKLPCFGDTTSRASEISQFGQFL